MKKLFVASMLAMAVTALAGTPARANGGFDFNFGIGMEFGLKWQCNPCFSVCPSVGFYGYGNCNSYSYVPPYYGPWGALAGSTDGHAAAPMAPAPMAPAPMAHSHPAPVTVMPSAYWYGAGSQPAGHHAPASYNVPWYWNGR